MCLNCCKATLNCYIILHFTTDYNFCSLIFQLTATDSDESRTSSSTTSLPSSNGSHSLSFPHAIPETHTEISQCLQKTCNLTQHVDDNYIPDEIVNVALNIMREQSNETFLIGQLTPAEMELALVSSMPLLITQHRRQCINIHHVNDHWVTSTYDPIKKKCYSI